MQGVNEQFLTNYYHIFIDFRVFQCNFIDFYQYLRVNTSFL
ncbi:hypothetical protein [uncultured Gammaproteobacteria bacterium]|nr:hypothetical protein [uncultured Gammaproteobacteria bacterium]